MKKCRIIILLVLSALLTGCSAETVFEQVIDQMIAPVSAQMRQLEIVLPDEAATPTLMGAEGNALYICNGYTISLQTMDSGNLDATMRALTGFPRDQLTVMQTERNGFKRYECVWSAAGEGGDQVARAVILDDGNYHYTVTVMADFQSAGELTQTWNDILNSVDFRHID